jgi:hypothetical protein
MTVEMTNLEQAIDEALSMHEIHEILAAVNRRVVALGDPEGVRVTDVDKARLEVFDD